MHIFRLLTALALGFSTPVMSKAIQVQHLLPRYHSVVTRSYENIDNTSFLSKRTSSPPSDRPNTWRNIRTEAPNNEVFQPEPWETVSSNPIRTNHALARGNKFTSLASTHDSHSVRSPSNDAHPHAMSNKMQSSASVKSDASAAQGAVEAQGQKIKFKASTSAGSALVRIHGPGSLTATLTQHNHSPTFGHGDLAVGQQKEFIVMQNQKLKGKIHSENPNQPQPIISGVLLGKGSMHAKAKDMDR